MTGPQHYRAAQELLAAATPMADASLLTRAQVHATLALAAATALNVGDSLTPIADRAAWVEAATERSAG